MSFGITVITCGVSRGMEAPKRLQPMNQGQHHPTYFRSVERKFCYNNIKGARIPPLDIVGVAKWTEWGWKRGLHECYLSIGVGATYLPRGDGSFIPRSERQVRRKGRALVDISYRFDRSGVTLLWSSVFVLSLDQYEWPIRWAYYGWADSQALDGPLAHIALWVLWALPTS